MISRSPQVQNNPNAQNLIRIIQNGDAEQGQQIAKNICESYGITPEQGVQQARQFFHM